MPELYQNEEFIYNQVPVKVFNHVLRGPDIYTVLHWHQNIEFNLTTIGRINLVIDGKTRLLEEGDWMIVNSGELHSNNSVAPEDYFEGITVQISKSFMDYWIGDNVRLCVPESEKAVKEIAEVLRMFGSYQQNENVNDLEKMELLFRFLSLVKKYCVDDKYSDGSNEKTISSVRGIVNYIEEHYREPIDLNSVAAEFSYTPAHLSRMFKEHIGYNFYSYLQNVRLMHCVEDMKKNPSVRLLDCSADNGFPNVKSFIQTFKKQFGCTPSEWLKKQKQNNSGE